jgi:hypothetical protein
MSQVMYSEHSKFPVSEFLRHFFKYKKCIKIDTAYLMIFNFVIFLIKRRPRYPAKYDNLAS